jgi:hypothetical protein
MANANLALEPLADVHLDDAHEAVDAQGDIGFELGWDHARWGITPPAEHLVEGNPVRLGWQAGRDCFGRRQPLRHRSGEAQAAVQDWLALRLLAWLRGLHLEALTVTPHHLAQLQVSHCPVTREALQRGRAGHRPQITRLCLDAGYAAGHLAMLGERAAAAQDGLTFEELAAQANAHTRAHASRPQLQLTDLLTPLQWARLAVLRAFVTPLPHAQAAALPLLVLPPNRLRLRNPIQGLQVLVTMLLAHSGWSKRLPQLEALMPHAAARRELHAFFLCLMAKAIAAKAIAAGRPADAPAKRWALEDAWRHPQVQAHWKRFALLLDADSAETALQRAVEAGLAPRHTRLHTDAQATEGWSLDSHGHATPDQATSLRGTQPRHERRAGRPRLQVVSIGAPQQLALPM